MMGIVVFYSSVSVLRYIYIFKMCPSYLNLFGHNFLLSLHHLKWYHLFQFLYCVIGSLSFLSSPAGMYQYYHFWEGNTFLHSCSHYVYFFNFNNVCSSFSFTFFLNFSCCLLLVSNQHFLFSNIYVYVISCFTHVWIFGTLWIVACQAPLSIAFSRQEYWSELLFPSPGGLPN